MMKQIHQRLVLFLTFGLSATGAWAQAHMAVVQPDRILIGPEFVPRAQPSQQVLVVPAGQTVIAPPDATWDSIEVAGTFRIARDRDTVLRVINLFVLPGGTLDMGTLADPIPCERKVEIILRDVPLDTAKDPFQWGNGLLNFGKQTRVGCNKTAFVETTGSVAAGATSITLASAPINWAVGDELLIPDTATPPFPSLEPRREKTVTIAAISGVTVTLSKPLDFAHNNIVDPQGVVVLRPRVANLTRNIVWRSENPTGSRGHTVDIGHSATWDIRYNQNIGLGRTRNEPHDDTVLATQHIGTNERGRYAEHHHHVGSSPTSVDMGNVYVGSGTASPAAKWALVVHQTSDTLIERNITIDFPGAGFVTEDGYEVRNVFRGNLSSYNSGHAKDAGGVFFDAAGNVKRNCPGCEGTGFWLRGVKNTFEGNEAWNNFTVGFNLFNQAQPPGAYPSAPGAEPDTALHQEKDLPLAFVDNVAAANVTNGLEIWSVAKFPYRNLIAAHTLYRNIFAVSSQLPAVYLQNAKVICEVGKGSDGIHSSMGYVQTFDMEGGQIAGCAIGIQGGGGGMGMNIIGTVLQNELNIDMTSIHLLMKDVLHKPLAAYPHRSPGGPSRATLRGIPPREATSSTRRSNASRCSSRGTPTDFPTAAMSSKRATRWSWMASSTDSREPDSRPH